MIHKLLHPPTAQPLGVSQSGTLCGLTVLSENAVKPIRNVTCARCLSAFAKLLANLPSPDDDTIRATAKLIGSRGGQARAAALTAEQRSSIARTAGKAPKKPRRPRCTDCPHVDYLTVSVVQSKHQCSSCGETFVDEHREKRYFGSGPV